MGTKIKLLGIACLVLTLLLMPVRPAAATSLMRISNVNTGNLSCLAVPGGSQQPGIGLILWTCNAGYRDHFWRFDNPIYVGNSYTLAYKISNLNSGQCLAVPGGSRDPGVQVIQWPCGNWEDHYWILENGRIINYNSRQCLAVQGGSRADGARIIQWPCGTWRDHLWHTY